MKKYFYLVSGICAFILFSCNKMDDEKVMNGVYHKDDKEGLRMFLHQQSAEPGKINAEWLGLEISDTRNWYYNEAWVGKIAGVEWSDESPKKIVKIVWDSVLSQQKVSGTLDANKWTKLKKLVCAGNPISKLVLNNNAELESLNCSNCQLSALDVRKNFEIRELYCVNNQITSLDLKNNTALTHLSCWHNPIASIDLRSNTALTHFECYDIPISVLDVSFNTALTYMAVGCQLAELDLRKNTELTSLNCANNQLTELDLSRNTKLQFLACGNNKLTALHVHSNPVRISCSLNHLPLSNIFELSEMIAEKGVRELGPQFLLPNTVNVGNEIDFSNQSVFNGINTKFEVITGGLTNDVSSSIYGGVPAPQSEYTLIDGKITFNSKGTYRVLMSNEAITSHVVYPAIVCAEINVY